MGGFLSRLLPTLQTHTPFVYFGLPSFRPQWGGFDPKTPFAYAAEPNPMHFMWGRRANSLFVLFLLVLGDMCVKFAVKNLVGGRTYQFQVVANALKSYEASEEVKFSVPASVKQKAITAGVVGGILFFIVAIILSVCAVKICNKRKRRKQEKGKSRAP